jgi:omega-6 fatty acid desaturase (delta-12 desaturase)
MRATAAFARDRRARSWWVVLSAIVLLGAAFAGTLPFWGWPFRAVSAVLAALLVVRLFVIYHDHQHRAILAKSRLAEALMKGVGVVLLAPSSVWRHSHNEHHAHNSKLHGSDPGSFPTMTVERFERSGAFERLRYRITRHPMTILCGYLTSFLLAMCAIPFAREPKRHWDGLLAVLLHLALIVAAVVSIGWIGAWLTVVLPFALAGCIGSYLFYAQHNFPSVVLKDEDGWTHEGAALESSSFLEMPAILHWFTANIGYHHIHHLNARIPFYRLPEAFRKIPELQTAKRTNLSPREIARCLRLKVWSTTEGRLVGFRR